ncbi:hypothetical protein TIFTF001_002111 [Ficus carica]|uniref:Uncharacterized protein n=1 Tax=Ficus carica TaxID=3494 RepID=A0AA88D6J1_FICCA|nr:hypothetical protein TIFTF001_002111 [Ficus carica]
MFQEAARDFGGGRDGIATGAGVATIHNGHPYCAEPRQSDTPFSIGSECSQPRNPSARQLHPQGYGIGKLLLWPANLMAARTHGSPSQTPETSSATSDDSSLPFTILSRFCSVNVTETSKTLDKLISGSSRLSGQKRFWKLETRFLTCFSVSVYGSSVSLAHFLLRQCGSIVSELREFCSTGDCQNLGIFLPATHFSR